MTDHIKTLDTAARAIRRALDDAQHSRLTNTKSRATRIWAALSGARQLMVGSDIPEIREIERMLTDACADYELCKHKTDCSDQLRKLTNAAQSALQQIGVAAHIINSQLSTDDELAIRRAVWARFTRCGNAPCPFPPNHPHREIWVDELTVIAREFADEIAGRYPKPEPDMSDSINAFCQLHIGDVIEGEIVRF